MEIIDAKTPEETRDLIVKWLLWKATQSQIPLQEAARLLQAIPTLAELERRIEGIEL